MLVVVGVLLGVYVITYPVFALTYYDIGRFPRALWSGFGSPHPWRRATVITYALGGAPVIIAAIVWRTSHTRAEMRSAGHRAAGD